MTKHDASPDSAPCPKCNRIGTFCICGAFDDEDSAPRSCPPHGPYRRHPDYFECMTCGDDVGWSPLSEPKGTADANP